MVDLTVKTSGWGINSYCIWKPCYVVQTISLSTSGQFRSILLMGDNEMALLSIEWAYRAKECTPARSYQLMHRRA